MAETYSARKHDRALLQHEDRWMEMRTIAAVLGRDSDEYRQAREDMIDAMREVRRIASLPRRQRYRRLR